MIKEAPTISRAELAERLGISERQVRKKIDELRAEKKLMRKGGKAGEWVVVE